MKTEEKKNPYDLEPGQRKDSGSGISGFWKNRRNRKKKNSVYSRLQFKIFMQTFVIVILAFLIIFTFYSRFWFRRVGDWIVKILQDAFRLDYEDALNIYQYGLRENSSLIIFGAVAVCFLLLFRFSLSWFVRYFNEIDEGIDRLIQGDNREITMSPEMGPMERKLNVLRQTLEKRELEAKLAEERKNNLVMYLAHDIRTPLTSVIGYLSLLEEAQDMPKEQKAKYVHITLEKANRLEQLINEFFEITRYNIQQIVLEKEKIDLYYMLLQMIEEFYPVLEEKGNKVVLHSDENVTVSGDPVKLARVFNNILKNAVAYSYPNTRIEILVQEIPVTEEASGKTVIRFQNQGKTIPKEKLTAVFDKFYRLDEARTSDTGGAGLGLAIAKEIVTIHGGRIFAESENGQITFQVELPENKQAAADKDG